MLAYWRASRVNTDVYLVSQLPTSRSATIITILWPKSCLPQRHPSRYAYLHVCAFVWYLYMNIHIHTDITKKTYIYKTNVITRAGMNAYLYMYVYKYFCVYMYIYVCMCVYMYMYIFVLTPWREENLFLISEIFALYSTSEFCVRSAIEFRTDCY